MNAVLGNKTNQVRDHVLTLLEERKLEAGDRIPGARDIAGKLGISFLKVQQAIDTLAQDGVLEIRGRQGAFVQESWQERVLHENICIFRGVDYFPWLKALQGIMQEEIPGLRFTHLFKSGMLELRTTLPVQEQHDQYMDLSSILKECYPSQDDFFTEAFAPLRAGDKLVGVPFSFSPRVIYYNTELLSKAGCDEPQPGWTWDAFIETARDLRRTMAKDRIMNWHVQPFYWLNFVMRSGGRLFDGGTVTIDSTETRAGLKRFLELGEVLDFEVCAYRYAESFCKGESAMVMAGRQLLNDVKVSGFDTWKTVPMPVMPGGADVTSQATDVLCVRKSCTNIALAREYIRMMLSERVQDFIGQQKYSIPIRKSSAFKSIDLTDPRDSIFAVEMGKLKHEELIQPPMLFDFVLRGLNCLLESRADIEEETSKLAEMARTYLSIRQRASEKSLSEASTLA